MGSNKALLDYLICCSQFNFAVLQQKLNPFFLTKMQSNCVTLLKYYLLLKLIVKTVASIKKYIYLVIYLYSLLLNFTSIFLGYCLSLHPETNCLCFWLTTRCHAFATDLPLSPLVGKTSLDIFYFFWLKFFKRDLLRCDKFCNQICFNCVSDDTVILTLRMKQYLDFVCCLAQ